MDLDLYSLFLTIACMALLAGVVASAFAYYCIPQAKEKMLAVSYFDYIKLIGLFAMIATLGALTYQFYYLTPVCEYCWWQRIFMFPIDFIAIGSVVMKIKKNETIIASLAWVGLAFAAIHYYFHYRAIILSEDVSLPCSSVGIIPSCTESPVLVFGFVTIPLMAVVVFIAILWLAFLAKRTRA